MIQKQQMTILDSKFRRKEVTLKLIPVIVGSSVTNIICIIRDDTENVELINNLKKSQERFQIIAENSDDIITLINEKGTTIYTSPSCQDILGFDYHEYVGKLFLHNIHTNDRENTNEIISQAIKEKSHFVIKFRQYNKENNPVWCESHGVPVFDSNGKLKHVVVITRILIPK